MNSVCYLHIGGPKTGTSSIQLFFSQNRDALKKKGILFPRSVGQPSSTLFPLLFDYPAKQIYCRFGAFNKSQRDKLKIFIKQRLESELVLLPSSDLFISSEELWDLDINSLSSLRAYLLSLGYSRIIVIAYFRHQLDVACSSMTTWSTNGISLKRLPLPSSPLVMESASFFRKLLIWKDMFGIENIQIIKYDPSSSVEQMLELIGLEASAFKRTSFKTNSSISNQGIAYLAQFNKIFPRYLFGRFLNPFRCLVPIHYIRFRYSGPYLPNSDEVAQYLEFFDSENNQIMKEFGLYLNSRYSSSVSRFSCDSPSFFKSLHIFVLGHVNWFCTLRPNFKIPRLDIFEQILWFIRINIVI